MMPPLKMTITCEPAPILTALEALQEEIGRGALRADDPELTALLARPADMVKVTSVHTPDKGGCLTVIVWPSDRLLDLVAAANAKGG